MIGRVEWAWVAAPLIAIVGAGAVIRLAQLDIGFARSRTELAILEVQGGYERAHVTRYTALYTSLSSSYTLTFDDPSALAMPFPSRPNTEYMPNFTDVAFRRDKETSLVGVQVSSNSTGIVHSEHMLPLGTSAKIEETLVLIGDDTKGFSVRNTTDLVLRDVGIFRRVDVRGSGSAPAIEAAYLAKIEPPTTLSLRFSPLATSEPARGRAYPQVWLAEWNKTPIFAMAPAAQGGESADAAVPEQRIKLWRLARLAADRLRLLPGDVRLVGWTDQPLPGMRIRPAAPQNSTYTLVVAHLARGPLSRVRRDVNVAEDYADPTVFDDPNFDMQPDGTEPTDTAPSALQP
jgi:hypothetical protein